MEYSLKGAIVVGLSAMSGYVLGFSAGFKDWKAISMCAGIGCTLGTRYIEKAPILNIKG